MRDSSCIDVYAVVSICRFLIVPLESEPSARFFCYLGVWFESSGAEGRRVIAADHRRTQS